VRYTIGELARRTGLTVKAVRFYSNRGIVPTAGRNPAGYRLYDPDAVTRLRLVRTLRGLGLDLATIREVIENEASLAEVAAEHAAALDTQIRVLRVRQAVLTAIARHGSTPDELDLVMTDLIEDFLDHVFGDTHPGVRRSMTPQLPADPSPEQLRAWNDLAELVADEDFREALRRMAGRLDHTAAVARGTVLPTDDLREWLADLQDPRRLRYIGRVAVVNGWAAPPSVEPLVKLALNAAH
jgi:DNA-binding transcriptional MerR regulator